MDALIYTFMSQMYWVDTIAISVLVLLFGISIFFRSKSISKRNQAYNTELTRLRTEIYNECEKNFFL